MRRFHDSMVRAGVLLDTAGLQPSSQGVRVQLNGARRTVIDGPFAETKEQLLGFYIAEAQSLDEVLQIARDLGRANPGGSYEIRPIAYFQSNSGGG